MRPGVRGNGPPPRHCEGHGVLAWPEAISQQQSLATEVWGFGTYRLLRRMLFDELLAVTAVGDVNRDQQTVIRDFRITDLYAAKLVSVPYKLAFVRFELLQKMKHLTPGNY